MVSADFVIAAARGWLDTPFRHQGRVRGRGCDCLGLLVGVAKETGLTDRRGAPLWEYDRHAYGHRPHGELLSQRLGAALIPISSCDLMPADIALFTFDHNPQHLGLITDCSAGDKSLIHAYLPAKKVCETRMDAAWHARLTACFRLPQLCV